VVIAMRKPEMSLRVSFRVGSSGESFVASGYGARVRPFSSVSNLVLCQSCLTLERSSTDLATMFLDRSLRGTTRTSNVTASRGFRGQVGGAGDKIPWICSFHYWGRRLRKGVCIILRISFGGTVTTARHWGRGRVGVMAGGGIERAIFHWDDRIAEAVPIDGRVGHDYWGLTGGLDEGVLSRRKGELGERLQTPFRQVERIGGGKVGGGEGIRRAKGIRACLHQRGKLAGSEDRVEKVFRESTARRVMMEVRRRTICERVPVELPLVLRIFRIEIRERRLRRETIHPVTLQGVRPTKATGQRRCLFVSWVWIQIARVSEKLIC